MKIFFFVLLAVYSTAFYGSSLASLPTTPAPKLKPQNILVLHVKEGDNLSSILKSAKISNDDIAAVIAELRNIYNPKTLKTGQKIKVFFDISEDSNTLTLRKLHIGIAGTKAIEVERVADDIFFSHIVQIPIQTVLVKAEGTINSSLFTAAGKAKVPTSIIVQMIKLYSYDVDFQREIRKGNSFRVLYEQNITINGDMAGEGDIIYALLQLHDRQIPIYFFTTPDNRENYYYENGENIEKSLLKTPVNAAFISSGFGKRKHPILGYTKMHKGVDFAAPVGTPVYAAGDGIIEQVARQGSYGNYVLINHQSGYKTAYAHLHRFGEDTRKGEHVKQGQIIGFVGSTGRATGPHLHYEIIENGAHVNPLSIKTVSANKLAGFSRAIFNHHTKQLEAIFPTIKVAQK